MPVPYIRLPRLCLPNPLSEEPRDLFWQAESREYPCGPWWACRLPTARFAAAPSAGQRSCEEPLEELVEADGFELTSPHPYLTRLKCTVSYYNCCITLRYMYSGHFFIKSNKQDSKPHVHSNNGNSSSRVIDDSGNEYLGIQPPILRLYVEKMLPVNVSIRESPNF